MTVGNDVFCVLFGVQYIVEIKQILKQQAAQPYYYQNIFSFGDSGCFEFRQKSPAHSHDFFFIFWSGNATSILAK